MNVSEALEVFLYNSDIFHLAFGLGSCRAWEFLYILSSHEVTMVTHTRKGAVTCAKVNVLIEYSIVTASC